jgi:hypothetical protein
MRLTTVLAVFLIIVSLALSITSIVLSVQVSNKLIDDNINKSSDDISSNAGNNQNGDKEKEGPLIKTNNSNTFNLEKLRKSKRIPNTLQSKSLESESTIIFISNILEHHGIENYLTHKHVNDQNKIEFSATDYEIGFTVHCRDFDKISFELREELETKYNYTCSHIFPKTKQFFKYIDSNHRNAHYSKYAEFYSPDQLRVRFYFANNLQPSTKLPNINLHVPQQYQSWII